jgi:hypothetical protein
VDLCDSGIPFLHSKSYSCKRFYSTGPPPHNHAKRKEKKKKERERKRKNKETFLKCEKDVRRQLEEWQATPYINAPTIA